MNTTLRTRILAIAMLGIPLALSAIGVSINQYRSQVENTELMERASAVAGTLDQLFAKVLLASNRSRSFALSGGEEFLNDYQQALDEIPPLVKQVKTLIGNRSVQSQLLPELEATLEVKLNHQANLVRTYQRAGFVGVRDVLIDDTGMRLEEFRTKLAAVRSAEYREATVFVILFRDGLLLQLAVLLSLVLCGGIWMSMLSATAIRGILMPVRKMIDHVSRIASHRETDELPVLRRDELGELALHINAMTRSVREAQAAREAARKALEDERQNLIDAVEALNDGFAAFDSNELLVHTNQKYREIYPEISDIAVRGVSLEALLRRRAEFGKEPEAKGRVDAWIAEKLADFRNTGRPSEYRMSDGRVIRKSEHRTRNGGTVGAYVDITQLKNAEAALRSLNAELDQRVTERTNDLDAANQQLERLNAELSTLIRSAPVAIMALDMSGRVTMWNPAASRLTGYTEYEARRSFPLLTAMDEEDAFEVLLRRVYAGETIDNLELELRRRDGSPFIANISAAALWDARSILHGSILTLVDLTEGRALQEQFQQSQKMEVVAELTAGLAHDFNNLLGIVISNLDMLESRVPKDGMAPELISAALRASLSGVALNRQLLAFSRRQALQPTNVDIRETIEGLKGLMHPTLGEHIEFNIAIQPGLWSALIDPSLLESAILNLAVNARDAMPKGGKLTVSAANQTIASDEKNERGALAGDWVVITVSDTGCGMPPDVMARAFEPFFTTKGFGKGSGLGLSMVYGFVRQSGGNVQIDSNPEVGTSIHMYLPRAAGAAAVEAEQIIGSNLLTGNGEIVLVVEDNEALRRAVVMQLQELGYETIEADSAKPALHILSSEATVDVMLTDIVMPGGMDGVALAAEAIKLRRDLPIIFTSGFPATTNGSALNSWPDRLPVLDKPVRRHELAESIREALDGVAASARAPLAAVAGE